MAKVIYAVTNGLLKPSVEAVVERQTGQVRVGAGANFAKVVSAIEKEAGLPHGSVFRFLGFNPVAKKPAWISVPKQQLAQPGNTYYFKVALPTPPPQRSAEDACWSQAVQFDFLHKNLEAIKGMLQLNLATIDEDSFREFGAHESESVKEMLSGLAACGCSEPRKLAFERRYGFSLSLMDEAGFDSRKMAVTRAGIALQTSTASFSCIVAISATQFCRSDFLPCNPDDRNAVSELAFLVWIHLLRHIKDSNTGLDEGRLVTLSKGEPSGSSLEVEIVKEAGRNMPSTIYFARDALAPHRELVLKVGHSQETLQLVDALKIDSRLWHQAENEARVFSRLSGCNLVPPLVFHGLWNKMPVVATERQGTPLLSKQGVTCIDVLPEADTLLRDLTTIVLDLERHGVAHGDIKPSNIGVYDPEREGRRFYLFDYGLALELPRDKEKGVAGSLFFSSCSTIQEARVDLLSELVAVVYSVLHLLRVALPWEAAAERNDMWGCTDARRKFARKVFKDAAHCSLRMFSSAVRAWVVFVLADEDLLRLPPSVDEIHTTARDLLSINLPCHK